MDSKFQMMHFTMNGLAIELNNLAIAELRDGSLHRSIQLITLACHLTSQQIHAHHTNVDQTYKFHWNDCAGCVIQKPLKLTQSTQAFLYLNFLTITPSSHYDTLDLCCPCGFAWAIWYNMALLYALVGAISGEKGHLFLQCAECFLEQVQIRTMRDQQQPSRDWSRVHLAVLNNQACISNELCMHARAEGQLTEMNLRLQRASDVLDGEVLKQFSLNFQCMQRGKLAGAA